MSSRFVRTELLLGKAALRKLADARIVVVGLGAVGSYAVEGLVRAGAGHLRLVDFDEVHLSNINRQLYALESTLGRPKVEVARERVLDVNPKCHVEILREFADRQTAAKILAGPPDVVIDAIDSVGPKVDLLTAAVQAGLRVISSMGAATRTDPLAIRVGDIAETERCPLARFIRRRLKKRGIETGIRCIYSLEPPLAGAGAAEDGAELPSAEGALAKPEQAGDAPFARGRTRQPLGSLSCLTGMFGLIAAREAIDMLVGLPPRR
jgi:tRNA threonylcarbamoyladenosine dehydratase